MAYIPKRKETTHIIVHSLLYSGAAGVQEVKEWTQETGARDGRPDCIYHYIIRKNGRIEPGRAEDRLGGHCRAGGYNNKSIGIAFEGNHDEEGWNELQERAWKRLYFDIWRRFKIEPPNVLGHSETSKYVKTTSPGTKINMNEKRYELFKYLQRDNKFDTTT